jgi:hypothetical protein
MANNGAEFIRICPSACTPKRHHPFFPVTKKEAAMGSRNVTVELLSILVLNL